MRSRRQVGAGVRRQGDRQEKLPAHRAKSGLQAARQRRAEVPVGEARAVEVEVFPEHTAEQAEAHAVRRIADAAGRADLVGVELEVANARTAGESRGLRAAGSDE